MSRHYKEPITNLSLLIGEEFIEIITSISQKFYPKEIGGFLIGAYIEGDRTAKVMEIRIPAKFANGVTRFYRDTQDLNLYLQELQKSNSELLYLGEWHSHPNGPAVPSHVDKVTMLKIARDPKTKIKNPIMGIMSMWGFNSNIEFYVVHNESVLKYEKIPL